MGRPFMDWFPYWCRHRRSSRIILHIYYCARVYGYSKSQRIIEAEFGWRVAAPLDLHYIFIVLTGSYYVIS
jgi:hypothetical protein